MIKIRNKSPAGGFSFNDDVNQRSARRRWTWKIVNVVNAHRAARLLICESTDRKHRTMGSNMREMTNVVSRPDIHAPVTKLLLARECRLCHLGIRVTTRHAANRFQSSIIFELEPLDRHRNGLGRMTTTTMTCFPCEIMLISVKRVIRVFSAPPFLLARFLPRDRSISRTEIVQDRATCIDLDVGIHKFSFGITFSRRYISVLRSLWTDRNTRFRCMKSTWISQSDPNQGTFCDSKILLLAMEVD